MRLAHVSISDPVPPVIGDDGTLYLLFAELEGEQYALTLIAFDRELQPVWEIELAEIDSQPDRPRIALYGDRIVAAWLAGRSLFTTEISLAGEVITPAVELTPGLVVGEYSLVIPSTGSPQVWYSGTRQRPGVYMTTQGAPSEDHLLVDPLGVNVQALFDPGGNLHVSWAQNPPGFETNYFLYAYYPQGQVETDRETAIHQPRLGTSGILYGPWLGVDDSHVYVLWNITIRTGQEAGRSDSTLISFPHGQPDQATEPRNIFAPSFSELPYEEVEESATTFIAGERVPYQAEVPVSVPAALRPATTTAGELAVASRQSVTFEYRDQAIQVGTLFFDGGQPAASQLLSFTSQDSVAPAVEADSANFLYYTWLEPRVGTFDLYFATTAPDIKPILDRVGPEDVYQVGWDVSFGLLSGLVLSPFLAIAWLILPLVVYGLTSFVKDTATDELTTWRRIRLLLLVLAFNVTKIASLPGIMDYVPFSAWIPLPPWMRLPLQIFVPLGILVAGIVVAWRYTYGRERHSPLYFLMIMVGVDGILTMSVYGVIFYNII